MGHEVSILTTDYELSKSKIKDLGRIKIIAMPILFRRFYIPRLLFKEIKKAVKNSDIILIVSHWSIINLATYFYARQYKKPYIAHPLGALPIYGRSKTLKYIYNLLLGARIVNHASACIVATMNEAPAFQNFNVTKEKIYHIPNGINEEDYLIKGDEGFRKRLGLKDKSPFILFMGRLNDIKGPDILLHAFNSIKDLYPDLDLVYIGPDEGLMESLKSYAISNEIIDRVHFLGFLSREDKSKLLNESLFLTVPSRKEAMSIVVLEAGAASKPALITDQCGFEELAEVNGGLIVPPTVKGLANGIENMMNIGDEISKLGHNLQALVKKNYLWSSAAKEHLEVYKKVIDSNQ